MRPLFHFCSQRHLSILFLSFALFSCATRDSGGASVGVPAGPNSEGSAEAFEQGLKFIRENPSEREDERIQHFLWLDQWIEIFERRNRLSVERGRELSQDLRAFVVEPMMSGASLEKILARAGSAVGKNTANYYLYLSALRESTIDSAISYLKAIQDEPYSGLYAQAQELLQVGTTSETMSSGKLGVLIPLTGELKNYGKEVMDALQTLSGFAASEGLQFVFVDSGSGNDSLQAALNKLVNDENVLAVIGPVTTAASQFVFERAELMKVPVISLAPRENLTMYGSYSFRSALTLRDQINRLAKFIRTDLGAKRVAMMFPENDYGWDAAKIAKESFTREGLEIKHAKVYAPETTDFKDPLKEMTRLDVPRARVDEVCPKNRVLEGCVKSINDLNPVLDFEVLFVPDFADAGGYLLPTLPFLKIYGVQVVGLSGFHSPKLLERAQDSAEGLIFTDSFFESSQDFKTRLFVNRYEELTGTKPSKIAAEAFDVGAMMISLLRGNSRSAVSREGLRESLSRLSGFDGVTGQMFSEAQQIRKEPQVLTVRNGRFQLLR